MKLNKRKGFTVVELVIVIAIIAVLAAVLIPTFAGLVRKANISKDTQLVRNLNTALATATEKPKTMHEALQIAADAGYLVDKINASATSNEILYDSKNNVFCYYNATNPSEGSVEYIPESAQGSQINDPEEYYLLWKIYDKNDDIPAAADQKFSVYLADDAKVPETITVSVGFDAGTNTKVKEVTYNGTKGNSVVIRTNGGTLTVDAETDSVNHYGTADTVTIKNVADKSYHEFGNVNILTIENGRVVVENGNNIDVLQVTGNATPIVAVPQNVVLETVILVESGKSFKVAVGDKSFEVKAGDKSDNIPAELEKALTKDVNGNLTFGVPGNYVAIIGTTPYETLANAVEKVAAGETIKLVKDSPLTKMLTITGKTFTLDLNGHRITRDYTAVELADGTNMTVQDTSATASGTIYSKSPTYCIIVAENATLTVKSGTVEGDNSAVSNSGTVNIEGTANLKRNIGYSVDCKSGSTTNMTGGTVFDIGTTENTYNYDVNISGGMVENYVYATSVTGGTIKDLILIKGCEVKNATINGYIQWLDNTVPTLTNVTLGEKFTIKNEGYKLVDGVIKANS